MIRQGMIGIAATLAMTTTALGQTEVNVVAFAPGFAWANLFGASETEKTEELLAFEKKEGITVNMEYADEETARQKVLLDLVNGTGKYDLVMLGSDGAVQTYSYSGYLEPLDGYLDTATDYFDASQVYPQFLDANRVDGKLWALPYYSFGAGVIYRKDLFDKYGITSFPKTIDEMEKALQTIKDGLAKDGNTTTYALTMRGAPGEEPSLDLTGFVPCLRRLSGVVRGRGHSRGDQGKEGKVDLHRRFQERVRRHSCAGRKSLARQGSRPTLGSI
jgi:ABC-type glycerol-3-phosphate transport system substrate-binding protein